MALRVIGAGFGRTGTTSLKAALEQLGFEKCHHMEEVARSGEQLRMWQAITDGEKPDWDRVFEGYQSSCDWPSCNYWEELAAHYPDAKVVLSTRDAERWYESVATTIHPVSYALPAWLPWLVPFLRRMNRFVVEEVWQKVFEGRFEDRAYALGVFHDHEARVKAGVPPDRLLVFQAKDGWEPLCEFLGVPLPEGPYPHLNDGATIQRALKGLRVLKVLLPLALVLTLGWCALG